MGEMTSTNSLTNSDHKTDKISSEPATEITVITSSDGRVMPSSELLTLHVIRTAPH